MPGLHIASKIGNGLKAPFTATLSLRVAVKQMGATRVASELGVSVGTLYNWMSNKVKPSRLAKEKLSKRGLTLDEPIA